MNPEAQSPSQASHERRRNRRFALNVPAVISQPEVHDLSCEIRDFCVSGLFLQFSHPDIAIGILARRANATVDIVFAVAGDSTAAPLRVPVQIKRLAPHGVGVAFVKLSKDVLRSLQRHRMASQRHSLGKAPARMPRAHLIATARGLLVDVLDQTLDVIDQALDSGLAVATMRASGIAEHSALLLAPRLFQDQRDAIRTRLAEHVLTRLDRPDTLPGTYERAAAEDLSLIDQFDFEDWLAATSEAARVEELFHGELAEIEPRLAQLTGFSYDRSNDPFGPDTFLHGYRAAIAPLKLPGRARQVAYSAMREALQDTFIPLYAELLALLPAVETRSPPRKWVNPSAPQAEPQRGSHAPGQAFAPDNGSPEAATASGPLDRLTRSLMGFFRNDGSASPTSLAPPAYNAPQTNIYPPGQDTQATSGVLHRLATNGQLPALDSVDAQQSLSLFSSLFDTLHADKHLGRGVRPFLQQLEATLVKLALADPAFLASPNHPAHKVLNTLDRLCMVAGDDGEIADERLLRLMNRWADRINAEAERNPAVFDEARIQLERVISPLLRERSARVFRLQELCEGRQHAEDTRRAIVRTLYERLGDTPVAQSVIDLWNGGWRNVLLKASLRGNADAEWEVIDKLVDWLAVKPASLPGVDAIQHLLRTIDSRLSGVCADKAAQDKLLDKLAEALLERPPQLLRPTSLAAKLGEAPPVVDLDAQQTRMADRLRIGDWLSFDAHPAPLNLIWQGEEPPVYVFANYRGYKKLDIRQAELLRALDQGTAAWIEDLDLPLMDRTYSAMILKMQNDLARQVDNDPVTGLYKLPSFLRALRRAWLRNGENASGYLLGTIQFHAANGLIDTVASRLAELLPRTALAGRTDATTLAWWQSATSREEAETHAQSLIDALTAAGVLPDDDTPPLAVGGLWRLECLDPDHDYARSLAASTLARSQGGGLVMAAVEPDDFGSERLANWTQLLDNILAESRLSLICHPAVPCLSPQDEPSHYELFLHVDARADELIPARDLELIAARLGRQGELDTWVLQQVFAWLRDFPERAALMPGFVVPVSAQALADPAYYETISNALESGDIAESKLIFSLSEDTAADGHARTQRFLRQLQRRGCRFMLDNFAGGASSFPYLKSLQLDFIKIERTLTRDIETSEIDEALVRSIIETAHYLGIRTIVGYVENTLLQEKLAALGVDLVQGYAMRLPVLFEDLLA